MIFVFYQVSYYCFSQGLV